MIIALACVIAALATVCLYILARVHVLTETLNARIDMLEDDERSK